VMQLSAPALDALSAMPAATVAVASTSEIVRLGARFTR
jgi:hypothetical protein